MHRPILVVIGIALVSALLTPVSAGHDPTPVDPFVGPQVCDRALIANTINSAGVIGSCEGTTTYHPPIGPPDVSDNNGNSVPDSIDAVVCAVSPGSCSGGAIVIPPTVPPLPSLEDSNGNGVPNSIEAGICALAANLCDGQGNLNPVSPPGDANGNGIPDDVDTAVCGAAPDQCDSGAIEVPGVPTLPPTPGLPVGPPSLVDTDGDGFPDTVEAAICPAAAAAGLCTDADFNPSGILGVPMEPLLGPGCDALAGAAPGQVCGLRSLTLGQAICAARAVAPGNGAVAYCSGTDIRASCSASTEPTAVVDQLAADTDCDGHSNALEAAAGCDALDPQSQPDGDGCTEGSSANPTELISCGQGSEPTAVVDQLSADADCDGHSNAFEAQEGCNPFNAAETPESETCAADSAPAVPAVPDVPTVPEP